MSVSAVIIARGGSQRVPSKNLLDFHGRPLVAHKVWQLKQCPSIDKVFVGSDSLDILDAAHKEGAEGVHRTAPYCDERSRTWNEVIYDMVTRITGDTVVWAHCTNPCIKPATYEKALHYFGNTRHDSIISVTPYRNHLWWMGKPLNFDPYKRDHLVAANLQPILFQNGGIFIAHRIAMQTWSYVYGPNPELMVVGEDEATDIDTQEDYERALKVYTP